MVPVYLCLTANSTAASYLNFKANLGNVPIFAILADKHHWRFYKLSFDEKPFSIKRAAKIVRLNGDEGSIDFLVNLKEGTKILHFVILISSMRIFVIAFDRRLLFGS